jgi:hypothetical protein
MNSSTTNLITLLFIYFAKDNISVEFSSCHKCLAIRSSNESPKMIVLPSNRASDGIISRNNTNYLMQIPVEILQKNKN